MDYKIEDSYVFKKIDNYSEELMRLLDKKDWNNFSMIMNYCIKNDIGINLLYGDYFNNYVSENDIESAIKLYELVDVKNSINVKNFNGACKFDNVEFAKWMYSKSIIPLDIFSELKKSCLKNRVKIVKWLDELIEQKNNDENF
jgi:hypothetical protein